MAITAPMHKALKPTRLTVKLWLDAVLPALRRAGADAAFEATAQDRLAAYEAADDQGTANPLLERLVDHARTVIPDLVGPSLHHVCPAGVYPATVEEVEEGEEGKSVTTLAWTVHTSDGEFPVSQILETSEEIGDVLVDLGLAGRTLEWDDILGLPAEVTVKTYGGRSSARVVSVSEAPI